MPTVGFLTFEAMRDLWSDDQLALPALRDQGIEVRPIVWTEPYDLASLDALVVRSPWDWFVRHLEFVRHLDDLVASPHASRVFNAAPLLRRFIDKSYLLELERRGVAIVPTEWLDVTTEASVAEILERRGFLRAGRALVKPAVSANAHGATIFSSTGDARAWTPPPGHTTFLVQPFIEEVIADGEWTFVFFDGAFSHAVKKTPARGDFRVQTDHGGSAVRGEPSEALIAQAEHAVRAVTAMGESLDPRVSEPPLYARVDGVVVRGELQLMELEIVEPELFFRFDEESPRRFAAALARRIQSLRSR